MSSGRAVGQATGSVVEVYQRFRHLIHEGAKFLLVGGIGFVIVLAGSDALHYEAHLGKFTSVTVTTVFATVITFLGNRYWSFKDRQGAGARSETVLFFLLNGVGLLIQYASIYLVTDLLGGSGRVWYTIANLIGIGIGTLFRFWSYRKWIWVHPEVHLARLARGRHRKGRTAPVPPRTTGSATRPAVTQPAVVQPSMARAPVMWQPVTQQPSPLAKRPVMRPGPQGGPASFVPPLLAATHAPAPANDDTDSWMS